MKKAIVIASAVIAILYSIYIVIGASEFLITGRWNCGIYPLAAKDYIISSIVIIISLLIVLISALVVFNVKPTKLLMLFAKICLAMFGLVLCIHILGWIFNCIFVELFGVIIGRNEPSVFIINGLPIVMVIVTLLIYIRRAKLPSGKEK